MGTYFYTNPLEVWPEACQNAKIRRTTLNGEELQGSPASNGYVVVEREWRNRDRIELSLEMEVRRIQAHPSVRMNAGKVALQRGPFVYCLEEVDNGENLWDLSLPEHVVIDARKEDRGRKRRCVISGRSIRHDGARDSGDSVVQPSTE